MNNVFKIIKKKKWLKYHIYVKNTANRIWRQPQISLASLLKRGSQFSDHDGFYGYQSISFRYV